MTRANPTSSIRSGFDYQDFWGLQLCGVWLVNPDQYKWIQFETSPDEEDPNKFYLDDIVCLDAEDFYHFYQIKHRQDPGNKWTWDNLLNAERKKGTSLIKKWSSSLLSRLDKSKEAVFITNGEASDEICPYLRDESLDIQKIETSETDLYNRFVNEIGSDHEVYRVFQTLKFRFNQENLSEDQLETNIRNYFYENLNATKSGVTNLLHEIRKECRQRFTKKLDINMLRKFCEFDTPRPLNEQFAIPPDFEFFNDHTHQSILSDLQNPTGGVKVIYGKPGVGKSVYLSKLDEELHEKKIICIKHHYHISPEDPSPQERLNAERVIEAIKSQFKSHKEELGDLANKNSKEIPVHEFVKAIATKLHQDQKAFVIIVDGLDHVLRNEEKEELTRFLHQMCVPQPGVWIVIGMQEVAKPYLPQIILERCPEDQWLEIKGLGKDAINNLIHVNTTDLRLPDDAGQFRRCVEKVFDITDGNPLHLRYTLKQLKNIFGNTVITEHSCHDLIPYGDGIETYYASLWGHISNKARTLLLTIASVNFSFTEEQLIECVSFSTADPTQITIAFHAISHLISTNARQQMSVYHNSFELFLKDRPEMAQQKRAIKTNVKKWLEQSSYEYLKWAELRIIEHELGNSGPILDIDREWLIDAICYPCNSDHIAHQMELATRVACEKEDFARALHISYLYTYYLNSKQFVDEATELIRNESLHSNYSVFDYINLELLPTGVFPNLAEIADSRGNTPAVDEIIKELSERLSSQEYRQHSIPPVSAALLHTLPYDRTHTLGSVYKYVVQFRDLGVTDSLFRIYAQQLLRLGQKEKLAGLLHLKITPAEERAILVEFTKYGLRNRTAEISPFLDGKENVPPLCLVYQALKTKSVNLPVLPAYDMFPATIREYDSEGRGKLREFYCTNFLIGLLYNLSGKQNEIQQWIANAPNLWSAKAMSCLFRASLTIASEMPQSRISYTDLFASWYELEELKWPEDREAQGFQFAFRNAIIEIVNYVLLFKECLGDSQEITLSDYHTITMNPHFFSKYDLTTVVLDTTKPLLRRDVYEHVRDENLDGLARMVDNFPERAKDYARFSKLARLYGDVSISELCLKKASNNLLGYGYHKDTYLFDVLEAIGLCGRAGTAEEKINEWISRLIPLIDNVGDYTDGDETHNLPFSLAALLAQQKPSLLYKYYYWSADREDLYHAEELFQYVIKSLPFVTDDQIALASTALDKDSLSQLKTISAGNAGAGKALSVIETYFGNVQYAKGNGESYPDREKPEADYSGVEPDHLVEHLHTYFENRWEWNSYMVGWANHWLGKGEKEKIYIALKHVGEKFGLQQLSGELLDLLYPLAYEFDSGVAFDLVCHAQDNDHGWQQYWTDKMKAESRWQFIQEKYPQRYLEFFKKSTNSHVPLARGSEYLLLFGDVARAEAITEASVQFAESLMADSLLPTSEWLSGGDEITELDILLQRLLWPGPLVRERAATAVAELLYSSEQKENVFKKLLSWIQQQKMETEVAIGLLPLIKAFYSTPDRIHLDYLNLQVIVDSIPVNSEVITKLADELALLTCQTMTALSDYQEIEVYPSDYSVNPFFSKHIQTFLAPIYFQRATEIQSNSGKPFIWQWSFTADGILKDAGIALNLNQVYYYARSEHEKLLAGFSSKISEAYRSAFLRVLQQFYKNGDIEKDFYLEYTYATLPVELSKWKILTNRSPEWWPKLEHPTANGGEQEDAITPISFQSPLEELIQDGDGKTLMAAEGAIQPAESWMSSDPLHSFLLVAFGYKVIGSDHPTAEEIAQKTSYSPHIVTIPSKTSRPFHFLESKDNYLEIGDDAIRMKDIWIYPIVAREHDHCIGLWQFFRDSHTAFYLNNSLSQDLKIEISSHSWNYQDSDGNTIGTNTDWLEGLTERYDRNMPLPHGQYLIINKDFIDEWLKRKDLRLGYVLKTTYRSRKYRYQDLKEYEECKLLNVGNIII